MNGRSDRRRQPQQRRLGPRDRSSDDWVLVRFAWRRPPLFSSPLRRCLQTPALPRTGNHRYNSCGSREQDSSSPSLQLSPSAHQFQAATATAKSPTSRLHRSSLASSSVSCLATASNCQQLQRPLSND
ncbi:hypothetical protein TB2_043231 [Malus domestica]